MRTISSRSTGSRCAASWPAASTVARASRSSTRRCRRIASSSTSRSVACQSACSGWARSTSSWARIPVSGLRSSWLASATNRRWRSVASSRPNQHRVHRPREPADLVGGRRFRNPAVEILRADGLDLAPDRLHRTQRAPGDDPGREADDQEQSGRPNSEQPHQTRGALFDPFEATRRRRPCTRPRGDDPPGDDAEGPIALRELDLVAGRVPTRTGCSVLMRELAAKVRGGRDDGTAPRRPPARGSRRHAAPRGTQGRRRRRWSWRCRATAAGRRSPRSASTSRDVPRPATPRPGEREPDHDDRAERDPDPHGRDASHHLIRLPDRAGTRHPGSSGSAAGRTARRASSGDGGCRPRRCSDHPRTRSPTRCRGSPTSARPLRRGA